MAKAQSEFQLVRREEDVNLVGGWVEAELELVEDLEGAEVVQENNINLLKKRQQQEP